MKKVLTAVLAGVGMIGAVSPSILHASCYPLPGGAVSWWRADGNSLDSKGASHGVFLGEINYATGKVNQAFSLSNSNSVIISTNFGFTSGSLTIEGWINPITVSSAQPIADFTSPNGRVGTHLWIGYPGTGNLTANLRDTSLVDHFIASPGGAIPANEWTHVALTYDQASGIARLFVNSAAVATANLGVFTPQTTSSLNLGFRPANQDTTVNQYFSGLLDELTIYNRALSSNEIAGIVFAGNDGKCLPLLPPCAPAPNGIVGWWAAEGNGLDIAGINHGLVTNGAGFAPGLVGQAFLLGGGNDLFEIPASTNFNVENFSIEGWIYPNNVSTQQALVDFSAPYNYGLHMWLSLNGHQDVPGMLYANLRTSSGYDQYFYSTNGLIKAGEWTHVALSYDYQTATAKLYANGKVAATANFSSRPRLDLPFYLGSRHGYYGFSGKMDEFSFYNRALPINEIMAIYEAGSAGKCGAQMPPSLTSPTNFIVRTGQSFTLQANASGSSPLSYQWFHDGTNVNNATASSLTILDANIQDAGSYSVVVTNAFGSVTGIVANVSVIIHPCATVPPGLVGWWMAEENGMDDANSHHALVTNGAGFASGIVGQAFLLGGGNDFVTVPASADFNVENFSIEGWIYPNNVSTQQALAEFSAPYNYGLHMWLGMNGNQDVPGMLYANLRTASGYDQYFYSTNGLIKAGEWTHVALTYDYQTGTARLYANGKIAASANFTTRPRTDLPFYLGSRHGYYGFSGKMDEFAFYNRVLTSNEIAEISAAGANGKCGPQIPPSVATTSTNLIVGLGGPMTLQANVSGTAPLFYQWLFNGTNLDGSTAGSLTIPVARVEDSGEYSVIVSNAFGVVTGLVANVSVQPLPPTIVTQPMSQSVAAGTPASFAVAVSGTPPFYFQWYFEGEPLLDATNATLTIPAAFSANAGAYQVAASNELDSVLSTSAVLTVIYPTARVFVPNATTQSGRTLAVPVYLVANGNENALQFSVGFSTTRLTLLGVEPGEAVGTATFLPNTNALANGRVGITLSLPTSQTLPFGTQEVARLIFQTAPMTNNSTTSLNFYDTPVGRQLVDAQARTLNVNFAGGTVSLAPIEYEADVAPRGATDRRVMANDWVQVGRFVAALDAPSAGDEFQRADCAPRSEGGNGILSATDWVQAGRYAAGLDALVMANGPTDFATLPGLVRTAQPTSTGNGAACTVAIAETTLVAGEVSRFQLALTSSGAESALTFTLRFDPAQMTFVRAAAAQATLQPTLNLNTNQLAAGKLGVALMLPAGQSYAAGEQQVISLEFLLAATAREPIALDFDGTLIAREVSTTLAESVATTWLGRTLKVALPAPVALLGETPGMMTFRWPTALGNVLLEATGDLSAPDWQPVKQNPAAVNGQNEVTLLTDGARKFYRLRTE